MMIYETIHVIGFNFYTLLFWTLIVFTSDPSQNVCKNKYLVFRQFPEIKFKFSYVPNYPKGFVTHVFIWMTVRILHDFGIFFQNLFLSIIHHPHSFKNILLFCRSFKILCSIHYKIIYYSNGVHVQYRKRCWWFRFHLVLL